jgi:hypothetical protein
VLVAASFWHINVFEIPHLSIIGIEQSELGEILIAFLLVIPAFFVDRVVTRQRTQWRPSPKGRWNRLRPDSSTRREYQSCASNLHVVTVEQRHQLSPSRKGWVEADSQAVGRR